MRNNLKKFQALLKSKDEALLLTGVTNRRYGTGSDIAEATAVVYADGYSFFTDSRYMEAAQRQMPDGELLLTDRQTSMEMLLEQVLQKRAIKALGIEENDLSVAAYKKLEASISVPLFFAQQAVDACRVVKEDWELAYVQQAQAITDQTFLDICRYIAVGMTEKQVYARLIAALYENGADGLAFDPIVVSGPNTSMPHGVAGDRVLQRGDFVTLDYGARVAGYCSDMTRTVALGETTTQMRAVYQVVLDAQQAAISATRAGMPGQKIDAIARKIITDAGYGAYFGHGYGHCLGLEIHELPSCSPSCSAPLPAGAISSAEPGIYLPGQFGVRTEDLVYVEPQGCKNLTKSTKELIIL